MRVQTVQRQHLNVLNCFELNRTTLKRFKTVQKQTSFKKYLNIISQFLCFIIRTADSIETSKLYQTDSEIASCLEKVQSCYLNNEVNSEDDVSIKNKGKSVSTHSRKERQSYNSLYKYDSEVSKSDSDSSDLSELNDETSSDEETEDESETDYLSDDNSTIKQKSVSSQLNQKQAAVLNLLTAFLKQSVLLNNFDSAINVFFACKSINIDSKSLKDSKQMSQLYSAFIYCSQLLTVFYSYQLFLQQSDNNEK